MVRSDRQWANTRRAHNGRWRPGRRCQDARPEPARPAAGRQAGRGHGALACGAGWVEGRSPRRVKRARRSGITRHSRGRARERGRPYTNRRSSPPLCCSGLRSPGVVCAEESAARGRTPQRRRFQLWQNTEEGRARAVLPARGGKAARPNIAPSAANKADSSRRPCC